jgi:hypothetical protein
MPRIANSPAARTPNGVSPNNAVPSRMNQATMGGWSKNESVLSFDQVQ